MTDWPDHWTVNEKLRDLHARWHDQPGNLVGREACGWEGCEFWDAAEFTLRLADVGGIGRESQTEPSDEPVIRHDDQCEATYAWGARSGACGCAERAALKDGRGRAMSDCHFDADDAMYGAGFCHTHGEVHPEVKDTQWFAFWEGVNAAVQHWANGAPVTCPYAPAASPTREETP